MPSRRHLEPVRASIAAAAFAATVFLFPLAAAPAASADPRVPAAQGLSLTPAVVCDVGGEYDVTVPLADDSDLSYESGTASYTGATEGEFPMDPSQFTAPGQSLAQ